ncbi:galactose mutarotase [Flavobacteriaceae bacterium TP-CH-4]|uniref:Aldose 1-epimerase n=1 Tax=Pelagihabitans pacificus TaxID=2696054 RepID=A0A967E7G4_9FLAO|nr:aldose epimerase family protein [Pelagihabitans pacificus]NHF61577.1 galactose mutarotase [Pelagihabitans pacificus]
MSFLNLGNLVVFFITFAPGAMCGQETKAEVTKSNASITISKSDYGTTPEGENVEQYTLTNTTGMTVKIITYGGRITYLAVPDRNGNFANVVLNLDSLGQYLEGNPFFGALVGRYGNRIANAKFLLDGKEYRLAANNGKNSLHGGYKGYDKVVWTAAASIGKDQAVLKLTYLSKDMEEGFPGNLDITVTYALDNENTLTVQYEATTDKKTIVNLTQHSYFNLSGDFSTTILDHELQLNAGSYLPVDETLIPTGELAKVEGTPFDFTTAKTIGRDIDKDDNQLKNGLGYDHCWVLDNQGDGIREVATLFDPKSGRVLKVGTTEPGLQFYSGNFLDGTLPRPNGGTYVKRSGLCLETQHYPDSPNQTDFPSVILNPGGKYKTTTTFRFSTK